jgi:hypothetical protein
MSSASDPCTIRSPVVRDAVDAPLPTPVPVGHPAESAALNLLEIASYFLCAHATPTSTGGTADGCVTLLSGESKYPALVRIGDFNLTRRLRGWPRFP